jgi:hypothetical protein
MLEHHRVNNALEPTPLTGKQDRADLQAGFSSTDFLMYRCDAAQG